VLSWLIDSLANQSWMVTAVWPPVRVLVLPFVNAAMVGGVGGGGVIVIIENVVHVLILGSVPQLSQSIAMLHPC
jgi:hypothetical protein